MKIEDALKKTIQYAKRFGMELDAEQLWARLMGPKVFVKKEFDEEIKKIKLTKRRIFSPEAKRKLSSARKMAEMITQNDKNILMVAVTGSVAAENCRGDDDIDILVVTREKRLWRSRLKLLFLLKQNKYKFRRYGRKERKDEFCFNMWLEEKSLKIPKKKQNERSAVDLILLKVLVDRNNIYHKFLKENDWAKKWVATGYDQKIKKNSLIFEGKRVDVAGDLVNLIAFIVQYIYMFPKITKEIIKLKAAFFHIS